MDGETKKCSWLQWARILVKNKWNFFLGTMHLVVNDYCYALQLWWKRLPWLSKVVSMKKKKGREKEKTREEGKWAHAWRVAVAKEIKYGVLQRL